MQAGWLLDTALHHLTLCHAQLLAAQLEGVSDPAQAAKCLNQAVDGLRQAGHQEYIARGLLARAALRRVQKQYDEAWADVGEAMEIAERGSMRLYQADGLLESARLHYEQEDYEKARACTAEAKAMIEEMGYHRRDREVEVLERVLSQKGA